ncbi:MAG: alpha/beta hydrolase [Alphaproteobacteria bacterium]|jgi:pimeloyl-ACP methyl ester carboxylesterase
MSDHDTTPQWLDRDGGHRLAYHKSPGQSPGIVFLGGYASDMTGTKAMFLDQWCREKGRSYLRFDYQGHGQSSGTFEEGTIGRWTADALAALDALTEAPQILIGSSMGGWIMMNLALKRPDRVAGLVGIAAAPDFSQNIWWGLSSSDQGRLMADGKLTIQEGESTYTVTRDFVQDGRNHLVMRTPIDINCSVRLLQGMRDDAVPWPTAHQIAERITSEDVVVTLIGDGDHRLSRDEDLARLGTTLDELLAGAPG